MVSLGFLKNLLVFEQSAIENCQKFLVHLLALPCRIPFASFLASVMKTTATRRLCKYKREQTFPHFYT